MLCAAAPAYPKRIRKPRPPNACAVCRKHLSIYLPELQQVSSDLVAVFRTDGLT